MSISLSIDYYLKVQLTLGGLKLNVWEKFFKLKEHQTDVKQELVAGLTTFMTIAYILVVNPQILGDAGMDADAVFTATAISAAIATFVMAFYANYPFALAPGMGLNAFFAYTIVLGMGFSWQIALMAVFIEGILFIILTFANVRDALVNAIPINMKHGVSVGIGLFIAFIGLESAQIVEPYEDTIVTMGDVSDPQVYLALIGLAIMGVLLAKKVKGALLLGILITTVIGIPLGVTPLPEGIIDAPPSLSPTAFQAFDVDLTELLSFDMLIVLFTFLFVDLFDTAGTLVGVASKANYLDDQGKLPRAKQALFADAVGTTVGSLLGTSTVTTYVESASGVAEGGRTGLTALTTGVLFLFALFFSPIFTIIPASATAPALILVGFFMMSPILKINFDDYTEAIPAFLSILMMPLAYSIAEGLVFGVLAYVILKLATRRFEDLSPVMYVLFVLFIIRLLVG